MIRNFVELENRLRDQADKPCLGVVCAHDMHTLEAVRDAIHKGLITAVLIGDASRIETYIVELGMKHEGIDVVDSPTDIDSAEIGVRLVHEKRVQALMKGKIQTRDFLKAVVSSETGIKESSLLSHFAIMELPNYKKLVCVTDAGMVMYPDLGQKKILVENAVMSFRKLGYDLVKVAALCAVEVVNPKMPEAVDAAALKEMDIPGALVEGPISYDLTFSEESARIKGYESPVTGDADVLLVPNISAGNILSKALMLAAGARMAGMVVGAKVPIVLTSRGASADEKFYSIVLATLCK